MTQRPLSVSAAPPGKNFGRGCQRFWENWPIVGHLMALVYWIQGKPLGEPERAAVWGSFGLVPFYNCWRCGLTWFRHWWCCFCSGPMLPSDCNRCSQNQLLHSKAAFEGSSTFTSVDSGQHFLDWMQHPEVKNKTLFQCSIPGSHDSAAYECAYAGGLMRAWSVCQHEGILGQLQKGARWFDLRLRDAEEHENVSDFCLCGKKPGKKSKVWVAHTFLTVPLEKVVGELKEFFSNSHSENEVVVIQMKPDNPTKLENPAWRDAFDVFKKEFSEEVFIQRSNLQMTIGELQHHGKKILLVVDNCYCGDRCQDGRVEQLVEQRGLITGSWSKTNSACPTNLQETATSWLKTNQSRMHQSQFYVLQAELTPDTPMVVRSLVYSRNKDVFLNLEDSAAAAHRVIRSSLFNPGPWEEFKINVITHDFVAPDVCAMIISKNFSNDKVTAAFLAGVGYPGNADDSPV